MSSARKAASAQVSEILSLLKDGDDVGVFDSRKKRVLGRLVQTALRTNHTHQTHNAFIAGDCRAKATRQNKGEAEPCGGVVVDHK